MSNTNTGPITMGRAYNFYLVTEAISLALSGIFLLFSLFVLQNDTAAFKEQFASPFFTVTWRAFLVSILLTACTLPLAMSLCNKLLRRPEYEDYPLNFWQWLMFFSLMWLITLATACILVAAFALWNSIVGKDMVSQFIDEFLAKFLVPYLLLAIFGLGGAAISGAIFNYLDNKAYADDEAQA